jgi:hypothetical protein
VEGDAERRGSGFRGLASGHPRAQIRQFEFRRFALRRFALRRRTVRMSAGWTIELANEDIDSLACDVELLGHLVESDVGVILEMPAQTQAELFGRKIDASLRNGERLGIGGDQEWDEGWLIRHCNLRTGTPYFQLRLSKPSSRSQSSFG